MCNLLQLWRNVLPLPAEQKMVAVCSFKTTVNCSKTTQYYIEKYSNIKSKVIGGMNRFATYTGLFISLWNMLENWLMPLLNEDSNDYIFQQDGSPAHYKDVRGYLNRNLPRRWIGRTGKEDDVWRVNAVATPVPGFNPVRRLFLLGVCEGHFLCASTPR